jgi:predicted DNA-binding helix-hairpin-helix protein
MNELVKEKLKILAESAKYDVSCGASRKNQAGMTGSTEGWGICHSITLDGRCGSLLKIMLSNYCLYDCAYCINRRSNDIRRATLSLGAGTDRPHARILQAQLYRRPFS